jgi:uncharacterized repeat protein (TIGR03803 family)
MERMATRLGTCLIAALLAACGGSKTLPAGPSSGLTSDSHVRAPGGVTPTNVEYKTIFRFKGPDGWAPTGSLTYVNGMLYGTTYKGGFGPHGGTVFKIATDGTGHVRVHAFTHQNNGPSEPFSGLLNVNGTLYGTTRLGNGQYGAVYSIALSGPPYGFVYGFGGNNGKVPFAEPTYTDGKLYGTTSAGESNDCGGIFEMTPTGKQPKTVGFKCTNGKEPWGQLLYHDGDFFGTTRLGGTHGMGTIFVYSSGSILHFSFSGKDGEFPSGALIAVDDMLYGTTQSGGEYGQGTLFRITPFPLKNPTILHHFNGSDGKSLFAGVIDVKGTLYGTTFEGGKYNRGTLFKIKTDGTGFTVLHDFGDKPGDGGNPIASLIDVNGTLYGTTVAGGDGESTCLKSPFGDHTGCGTIFSVSGI